MQLKCEQCGAPFRASDLHLQRGLATCAACGSVQHLPSAPIAVGTNTATAPAQTRKPIGDVPIPPRCTVEDEGQELVIRLSWFHGALYGLLFFVIAWDSFLVFWYSTAFSDQGPPGPMQWIIVVFPIAHVAVGVGLTYTLLTGFLNSTAIRVADGLLTVHHGPLPWIGNRNVPTDSIEQIYCQCKLHGSSQVEYPTNTPFAYEVHAIIGSQKVKLLGGLQDSDHAFFIEQRLERFLGIEDRPVPGEMSAM